MESGLPNIFNQYSLDENRVTNALLQTLYASPALAKSFLKRFVNPHLSSKGHVSIWSQKRPKAIGDRVDTKAAIEQRDTIPDGWIVSEEGWTVVIENKLYPRQLREKQLAGHIRNLPKKSDCYLLLLTPDKAKPKVVADGYSAHAKVLWHSWPKVHHWASQSIARHKRDMTAGLLIRSLKEFLEMYDDLSDFQGITFDEGFDPPRAKVILKHLMDKLAPAARSTYGLTKRRPRITADRSGVWDCFGEDPDFTQDLHFTVNILDDGFNIALTLPNAAKDRWRNLASIGREVKQKKALDIAIDKIRAQVPELWVRLEQRHFINRRQSVRDARLDFNVDTCTGKSRHALTKRFPVWFDAVMQGVQNKSGANFQLQFRALYSYEHSKIGKPAFSDISIQTLRAFRPLYDLIRA